MYQYRYDKAQQHYRIKKDLGSIQDFEKRRYKYALYLEKRRKNWWKKVQENILPLLPLKYKRDNFYMLLFKSGEDGYISKIVSERELLEKYNDYEFNKNDEVYEKYIGEAAILKNQKYYQISKIYDEIFDEMVQKKYELDFDKNGPNKFKTLLKFVINGREYWYQCVKKFDGYGILDKFTYPEDIFTLEVTDEV